MFTKKLIKNKKGSSTIEVVIGILLIFMVFCLLTDVILLGVKLGTVSSVNSKIIRTVSVQGGLMPSAPTGYPGGNGAYQSSAELLNSVRDSLRSTDIEANEFDVFINGVRLTAGTNIQIDYLDSTNTQIVLRNNWSLSENFVPGSLITNHTSRRSSSSEFKYNYNSWTGE